MDERSGAEDPADQRGGPNPFPPGAAKYALRKTRGSLSRGPLSFFPLPTSKKPKPRARRTPLRTNGTNARCHAETTTPFGAIRTLPHAFHGCSLKLFPGVRPGTLRAYFRAPLAHSPGAVGCPGALVHSPNKPRRPLGVLPVARRTDERLCPSASFQEDHSVGFRCKAPHRRGVVARGRKTPLRLYSDRSSLSGSVPGLVGPGGRSWHG